MTDIGVIVSVLNLSSLILVVGVFIAIPRNRIAPLICIWFAFVITIRTSMLFGAIIPTLFILLAAVGMLLLIAFIIGVIALRVDWMKRLAILGGILGLTLLTVYALLSFVYPPAHSAPTKEVFANPQAIDIDQSGNLFVLDEPKKSTVRDEQTRIFKFAPNGRLLATWSNRELLEKMGERKISLTDISIGTSGQIYLLSRNDWIWKVDEATTEGKAFSRNLQSFDVDIEGRIIVVTADMDVAIARGWRLAPLFNFQEALLQIQTEASSKKPAISFALGKGKKRVVYIVDQKKDQLLVYDEQGILTLSLNSAGPKYSDFKELRGITVNKHGNIFISEAGNHRIIRLSPKGVLRARWGRQGKGIGEFGSSGPGDIAVDKRGQVYVVDSSNRRIQKFSSNGKFIFEIKGSKSQANRRD